MLISYLNKNLFYYRDYIQVVLVMLVLLAISIVKSYSVFNFTTFYPDEQFIVPFAVGFLDFDLNPGWFDYHPLPMYILSLVYGVVFLVYYLLGMVSSKIEFVSLFYSQNELFYIVARIVFGYAYVCGCFVLTYILYKHYSSKIAAIIFFISVNIIPDGIFAANWVRVDTFVFLFLTIVIYFGYYAKKCFLSYLLSIMFCSAAFASKLPAIAFYFPLFVLIANDIKNATYPRKYFFWILPLSLMFVFIFMPYAFLDSAYSKSVFDNMVARTSGVTQLGKEHHDVIWDRLWTIFTMIDAQSGMIAVVGTGLLMAKKIFDRSSLFLLPLFVFMYVLMFTKSAIIDSYWFRPIYPLTIFFTVILALSTKITCNRVESNKIFLDGIGVSRIYDVVKSLFILSILIHSGIIFKANLSKILDKIPVNGVDNRIVAAEWIQGHIPDNSTVWLDGYAIYHPRLFSKKSETMLQYYVINKNNILVDAVNYYRLKNERNYKSYNLRSMGYGKVFGASDNDCDTFFDGLKKVKQGDYIIVSSKIYNRYTNDSVIKAYPKLTTAAKDYYALIYSQELIKSFLGSQPEIFIYLVKSNFGNLFVQR